ncbi:MAG: hypothetical protein JWM47_2207 [Acidimicrobiales bacterium]|nr:hypothetical protein [Acidimicrobiales bacterium]
MTEQPGWPAPPREPGPWGGGPPVAPPGNTPLPPLPGPGGVSRTTAAATNPWTNAESLPAPPPPHTAPPRPPFPGLNTAAIPRIDRAPRWLVALAALVVVAMLAGGAYVVVEGGRQYPSEWDERVAPIAEWVAKTRKLDFKHKVEVSFLSEAEYRAASTDDGGGSTSAEDREEEDDAIAQLRALGLIEGKVDLGKATDALSDTGTLAFYDQNAKKVFVRGTELTAALRVTLAHELTHVLQDQHFDLTRLADLPENEAPVLRALAEGDAESIEEEYAAKVLTAAERAAYEKDAAEQGQEASETLDKEVPPILSALFQAPYIFGPTLVEHLQAGGGDLDEAFDDVPNEEVLFNPLIFDTTAAEAEPLSFPTPAGADEMTDGLFGPIAWYLVLASRLPPATALAATDGLAGDGYVVYRQKGTVCVEARSAGDTPADVQQLSAALGEWVKTSPKGSASVEVVDGEVRFRSCDPGEEVKGAGQVSPELLVLPVTRTQVYDGVIADGGNADQASCFADKIVMTLTVEQLTESTYLESPVGAAALQGMQLACFR